MRFAADEEELFSPYGLRGVTKRDEQYYPGTGYWRGPVWVSVNYMVLRGLYLYYHNFVQKNPLNVKLGINDAKDLYNKLRVNML